MSIWNNTWDYRHFILSSIRNEFKSRFIRSKLGGLWMIINPLTQVAIYMLILSHIVSAKLPGINNKYAYTIYLMAGFLGWALFTEIITRCLNLFIEQSNLIKKMNFPRITLPSITVGLSLVNNALLLMAMIFLLIIFGYKFSLTIFWLIPLSLLLAAFAMALGLLSGILNVFLRDVGQVVPIFLQLWFWCTPIVYPVTILPEHYRHLLHFNPMYLIIKAYQEILLYGIPPKLSTLTLMTTLTMFLLVITLILFRRANEEMVDAL